MPKWWTEAEEDVLKSCASLGAAEVRRQLLRIGTDRSIAAIKTHASRIGVTLHRYETCPLCGGRYEHLTKSGRCPVCERRERVQEERVKSARLRAELAQGRAAKYTPEYQAAERELVAIRQENSRIRRGK